MNEAEREVATGVLNLAALWLFLQYVLPVIAVLAIAYFIYRAVSKPHDHPHEFVSSEPEDRLHDPDHDDWSRR